MHERRRDFLAGSPRPRPPRMARRRILRTTSAWPSLVTLGNGVAGFAAIHFATRPLPPTQIAAGETAADVWMAGNLVIAAWMIFVGLLCDALDGSLARRTGHTSEFGAQLDSLCDAVTFGVAPAVLMLRAVQSELFGFVQQVDILPHTTLAGRAVWFIAAVYAACALLRLARFNVENTPDVTGHMAFKGLPSPAAAMSVTSLVLLHEHVASGADPLLAAPWLSALAVWLLPAVTLASGLLMVSQIRFAHVANTYLRGRRPFRHIVWMAVIALAAIAYFHVVLVVVTMAYVLSGPVCLLWSRYRGKADGAAETAAREHPTRTVE
ncbi:MAG: phosphatidylcholine/phosphatidylserine synthase [Planctomycetes bacterium]|nr:phosphatidylcholine/phosphatidylserine synthase [Planctomycetota bacterium]